MSVYFSVKSGLKSTFEVSLPHSVNSYVLKMLLNQELGLLRMYTVKYIEISSFGEKPYRCEFCDFGNNIYFRMNIAAFLGGT